MDAPWQCGQGDGSGRGSGWGVRQRKRQGGQLRHLVHLVCAEESPTIRSESRGPEFLRNIEVAGLAASGRD